MYIKFTYHFHDVYCLGGRHYLHRRKVQAELQILYNSVRPHARAHTQKNNACRLEFGIGLIWEVFFEEDRPQ